MDYVMPKVPFNKQFWYGKDTVWDNTVEFNFITGNIPPVIDLFDGNVLTLFNTDPSLINPATPAVYAITTGSSTSYNQFIQDLRTNPKLIRRMIIAPANSADTYYTSQPLSLLYRDANGIECTQPKITNTFFSKNQFQNLVNVDFEPGEMILDNNTIISQYQFEANATVKMVLFYKEIKLYNMLSHAGMSLCKEACDGEGPPDYTEEQLDLMSCLKLIPTTIEDVLKKKI
jgi:hypothetical protein